VDVYSKAVFHAILKSIIAKSLYWTKARHLGIVINVNREV